MREHKDDFIAFLPSIGGEDTAGATDDGMMDDAGFEKYCRIVAETGEWGGEPEVGFLSSSFFSFLFPLCPLFSIIRCFRYENGVQRLTSDPSTVESIPRPNPRHSKGTTHSSLPRWLRR